MSPATTRVATLALALAAAGCLTPRPDPVPREEVVARSAEGESPESLITRIRDSGTVYVLHARDVVELIEAGVPEEVVDFMMETRLRDLERHYRARSGLVLYGGYWPGRPFGYRGYGYWPCY